MKLLHLVHDSGKSATVLADSLEAALSLMGWKLVNVTIKSEHTVAAFAVEKNYPTADLRATSDRRETSLN